MTTDINMALANTHYNLNELMACCNICVNLMEEGSLTEQQKRMVYFWETVLESLQPKHSHLMELVDDYDKVTGERFSDLKDRLECEEPDPDPEPNIKLTDFERYLLSGGRVPELLVKEDNSPIYSDDNFGVWDNMDEPGMREFYAKTQRKNVLKVCADCGRKVRIKKEYDCCNRCADIRERGYGM